MKITVAICTRNRANLLNKTLGNMISLRIPSIVSWEILVVNNNSTDHTDSLITSYTGRLPIRKIFEECPGLSNARNHALRDAQGDLILWTDDDVLVDRDWLSSYVVAANQWPTATFFGGPIDPWFEDNPPRWLESVFPKVESAFAVRNLGQDPCRLSNGNYPYGANMAMRTNTHRYYKYNPDLGLKPNSRMGGEEIAVFEQMTRDGLEGRWVPEAKVQHFIPKDRQTIKYLRSYYRGQGQVTSLMDNKEECSKLFGRRRWAVRKAIEHELLFLLKRGIFPPELWIDNLIQANIHWGISSAHGLKIKQPNG